MLRGDAVLPRQAGLSGDRIWGGGFGVDQPAQGSRQVASVLDNMDVLPDGF